MHTQTSVERATHLRALRRASLSWDSAASAISFIFSFSAFFSLHAARCKPAGLSRLPLARSACQQPLSCS